MDFLEEDGFFDFSALMRSAIYALVRRGEVVYVGQSVSPIARIYGHQQGWSRRLPKRKVKGIVFDEIWIRPCHQFRLDDVEQEFIRKYQPKHNVRHKPRPGSLDLAEIMKAITPLMPTAPEPRTYIRRRI